MSDPTLAKLLLLYEKKHHFNRENPRATEEKSASTAPA
jgi:hypothetical protein